MKKIFRIFTLACFLVLLNLAFVPATHAFTDDVRDNEKIITVFANLDNQIEVNSVVQNAFDSYNADIVRVLDIRNQYNLLATDEGWVTNSAQYYYGDMIHGSKGTIKCYVVQTSKPSVSSCSGSVYVAGNGVKFVSKSISNNNSLSARLNWTIRLEASSGSIPTTKSHSVGLYS